MPPRPAILLIVSLVFATSARARLGETLPELIARFGEPVESGKFTLFVNGNHREVGQACRFRVDDWAIDVVMIDDICARIRYGKSGDWSPEQIDGVLERNAGGPKWTEQPSSPPDRKWLRSDGATATWSKAGLVLTLPLYDQRREERKAPAPRAGRRAKS